MEMSDEEKVAGMMSIPYKPVTQKICTVCKEMLPIAKFGTQARALDRHRSKCKVCNTLYTKKARHAKTERLKAEKAELLELRSKLAAL